ncbi:MAG: phosphoethanolamine transferase [Cetobacterium sp.]
MLKNLTKDKKLIERILFIGLLLEIIIFFKYNVMSLSPSKKFLRMVYGLESIILINILIVLVISIIKNRLLKRILRTIYIGVISLMTVIEALLLLNFNTLIEPSTLNIFIQTNSNEAFEFIELYMNKNFIIVLLLIAFVFLFDKFLLKKINIDIEKNKNYIFVIIFISLVTNLHIFYSNRGLYGGNAFTRLYTSIKIIFEDIREYKKVENNLKNEEIILLKNDSKIKNIILVLGESTGKNHMSLYNYKRNTNPLLKELEKNGNLYKYTDVISPHSHTIPTIQKLFTYKNYESKLEWYESDNLIDIMKTAGYKTHWISNQESIGIWGNVAVAIGKRSDKIEFNDYRKSGEEAVGKYDEQLISRIDLSASKSFIVMHLMGTHGGYKYRYPKNWNKFTDENIFEKEKVIAEYDNAVLYNDYVLYQLYEKLKDEEAIILYLSDHGEEVYDFRDFVGHTETNGSRYMVEIPFMFIATDKFKEKYPEKIKAIEASLNNSYMTDDLMFTILDLVNVKTKEFDETRSVINEKFNSKRVRIFNNKNYDLEFKSKN